LCAALPIRAECSKHAGKFVEPLDADLRRPELNTDSVAFVEHPVRQLATKIVPLMRIDACNALPRTEA